MNFMWRKLKKGIKRCDFYGHPSLLLYKGERYFRSKLGGVLTLALFALGLMFTVDILRNYSSSSQMEYSIETSYSQSFEISFNESNSFLLIGILQEDLGSANNRSYYIQCDQVRRAQGRETVLPFQALSPCTYNQVYPYIPNLNPTMFDFMQIGRFLCTSGQFSFQTSGSFTSAVEQFLRFRVTKCTGPQCKYTPNTQVQLNFYFSNSLVNPLSAENPISQVFQDRLYYLINSQKNSMFISVYFSYYQLEDDLGTLFPDIFQRKGLTFLGQTRSSIIGPSSEVFRLEVRKSKSSYIYSRKFHSLTKTISLLGGIFSVLMFVGNLVGLTYNNIKMQVSMSNQLFNHRRGIVLLSEQERRPVLQLPIDSRSLRIEKALLMQSIDNRKLKFGIKDFFSYILGYGSYVAVSMHAVRQSLQTIYRLSDMRLGDLVLSAQLSPQEVVAIKLLTLARPVSAEGGDYFNTKGQLVSQIVKFARAQGRRDGGQRRLFFGRQIEAFDKVSRLRRKSAIARRITNELMGLPLVKAALADDAPEEEQ